MNYHRATIKREGSMFTVTWGTESLGPPVLSLEEAKQAVDKFLAGCPQLDSKGRRLCDWCAKPIGMMWILADVEVWKAHVDPKHWKDYICLRCWRKIPSVPEEHKCRE